MPRHRLLFVVTEDWYFVSHRLPLAVATKNAGYEVMVATRPGGLASEIQIAGIRLIPFEISRSGMNPFREMLTLLQLYRLIRELSPDILHTVGLKPVLIGGLAGRLAGMRRRVAAIAGMGSLFAGANRGGVLLPIVRRLLRVAMDDGLVIVQNRDDARLLEEIGVVPSRLRLIRGVGVDTQRFCPSPEPAGRTVVMLPSRLLWDKGVGEFVEAARILGCRGCDARFVLVGAPDPDNPATVTEEQINIWVKEGIIEWWGHRNDMEKVHPRAHVVCLPSYREGLPKVLLEAMACGRPVITCDVPGCREIVQHGKNGLIVSAKDPIALADAIERLLGDPELRMEMGMESRRLVEKMFSQEKAISETLSLYGQLMRA